MVCENLSSTIYLLCTNLICNALEKESCSIMTSSNDESSSKVSLGQPIKISTLISAVGIGVFMSSLDASIVVVILEKIQQTYAVGPSQVQWVLLSYLLVMMAFTVIAGDLGDKISNKRIYQIGMILFGLGSLMCFFALDFLTSSIYYLLIGRVIQSFGATYCNEVDNSKK